MSLTFGAATSDVVDFGTGVGTTGSTKSTIWAWIYPTASTANRFICAKNNTGTGRIRIMRQNNADGTKLEAFVDRATTCTSISAANALTLNAWQFVAAAYDESQGATTTLRLYLGTLTSAVAELSYSSQTQGTGATLSDDGKFLVGNRNPSDTLAFPGRIAAIGYVDGAQLSVGDLRRLQYHAQPTPDGNTKLLALLGYNGTGSQPDWSGNGHAGTVTGATQSDHVPLGPMFGFSPVAVPYVVAAAASTYQGVVLAQLGNFGGHLVGSR